MSTPSSPGTITPFQPDLHAQLIPYIAALHASCITHDRTPATFVPPLSHVKLLYWWKDRIAEVAAGTRHILLLVRDDDPASLAAVGVKGTDVLGVVMLGMPPSETDVFRASVEKLLIHTSCRRRGGARTLVQALEAESLQRGRTLLVSSSSNAIIYFLMRWLSLCLLLPSHTTLQNQTVNVESGCPAENLFRNLGYTEVGKIPDYYSISPQGGSRDATFFYKQLAA